jgi:hypothetical protein
LYTHTHSHHIPTPYTHTLSADISQKRTSKTQGRKGGCKSGKGKSGGGSGSSGGTEKETEEDRQRINAVLQAVDVDGSGEVDYQEFIQWWKTAGLQHFFDQYDATSTGKCSVLAWLRVCKLAVQLCAVCLLAVQVWCGGYVNVAV